MPFWFSTVNVGGIALLQGLVLLALVCDIRLLACVFSWGTDNDYQKEQNRKRNTEI